MLASDPHHETAALTIAFGPARRNGGGGDKPQKGVARRRRRQRRGQINTVGHGQAVLGTDPGTDHAVSCAETSRSEGDNMALEGRSGDGNRLAELAEQGNTTGEDALGILIEIHGSETTMAATHRGSLAAATIGRTLRKTAATIALCALSIAGDAQYSEKKRAWDARDARAWDTCSHHFAKAAHAAYERDDLAEAARNGYWTARCASGAKRRERAERWAQWTRDVEPRSLHAMLLGATNAKAPTGAENALVESVIAAESGGQADAVSRAGAIGLMQVMPETAKDMTGKNEVGQCLREPQCNRKLGTRYLSKQLEVHGGNMIDALVAYNAGPTRARKWKIGRGDDPMEYVDRMPFDETRRYVARVLAGVAQREGAESDTLRALRAGKWPMRDTAAANTQETFAMTAHITRETSLASPQ